MEADKQARDEINAKINKTYYTSKKFILNSDNIGTNIIDKENRISYMDETLITELDAKVFFEVFNVQENGYKRKDIIDKIHIKVCSDI